MTPDQAQTIITLLNAIEWTLTLGLAAFLISSGQRIVADSLRARDAERLVALRGVAWAEANVKSSRRSER